MRVSKRSVWSGGPPAPVRGGRAWCLSGVEAVREGLEDVEGEVQFGGVVRVVGDRGQQLHEEAQERAGSMRPKVSMSQSVPEFSQASTRRSPIRSCRWRVSPWLIGHWASRPGRSPMLNGVVVAGMGSSRRPRVGSMLWHMWGPGGGTTRRPDGGQAVSSVVMSSSMRKVRQVTLRVGLIVAKWMV